MNDPIRGRCFRVGDGVTAYQIIARARWTEPHLGDWLFEDLEPDAPRPAGDFRQKGYSVILAGSNFGCGGKSNDYPVLTLKDAGVDLVIAASFNRIFYRNAINLGLPVVICPGILSLGDTGHEVMCDLAGGRVTDLATGASAATTPLSALALDILRAGDLLSYYKALAGSPERLFASK